MRALSVWNPWAWALCAGLKTVENRGWRLPAQHRGRWTLIHCGLRSPRAADCTAVAELAAHAAVAMPKSALEPHGAVIGAVIFDRDIEPAPDDPWAVGPRCWAVRPGCAVLFDEPLACKGALGFFDPGRLLTTRCHDLITARRIRGEP